MLDCERKSRTMGSACAPVPSIDLKMDSRFSARVAEMATVSPACASASAVAAPTPYDAPVTKAVRLLADVLIGPVMLGGLRYPDPPCAAHRRKR